MQSTLYDAWGLLLSVRGFDTIVVLGVSGCIFLPLFRLLCRKRLIVNIDGLEHRRAKWGKFAKWFLRTSEAMAVRHADVVVADNKGIQDYVQDTYGKKAALIAYGGDHVLREVSEKKQLDILQKYGLEKAGYAISVCRIEPENNCHITLEAFAHQGMRLVFVGNWEYSEYGTELKKDIPHILILRCSTLSMTSTSSIHCALMRNSTFTAIVPGVPTPRWSRQCSSGIPSWRMM